MRNRTHFPPLRLPGLPGRTGPERGAPNGAGTTITAVALRLCSFLRRTPPPSIFHRGALWAASGSVIAFVAAAPSFFLSFFSARIGHLFLPGLAGFFPSTTHLCRHAATVAMRALAFFAPLSFSFDYFAFFYVCVRVPTGRLSEFPLVFHSSASDVTQQLLLLFVPFFFSPRFVAVRSSPFPPPFLPFCVSLYGALRTREKSGTRRHERSDDRSGAFFSPPVLIIEELPLPQRLLLREFGPDFVARFRRFRS